MIVLNIYGCARTVGDTLAVETRTEKTSHKKSTLYGGRCVWIEKDKLFQFFTKLGSFDIDDIILNMLGIICGYLMLILFKRVAVKGEN